MGLLTKSSMETSMARPAPTAFTSGGERVEFRDLEDGDEIQFGNDATATYSLQAQDLDRILSSFENTQIVGL
jgi:hypothetical protein